MDQSIRVYTKKARADAPGTMVGVRLQPDELELLDLWIAANGDMSRPEAMRRILKLVAVRMPG
jgi:hypothetical protein